MLNDDMPCRKFRGEFPNVPGALNVTAVGSKYSVSRSAFERSEGRGGSRSRSAMSRRYSTTRSR